MPLCARPGNGDPVYIGYFTIGKKSTAQILSVPTGRIVVDYTRGSKNART